VKSTGNFNPQVMKIVIAGGSGFLGKALAARWSGEHEVVILSRTSRVNGNVPGARVVEWNGVDAGPWNGELEGADLLLNLAGKSVNCRYNKANKAALMASRIDSTRALGRAVEVCKNPPGVWMNSSSATIYPHAESSPRDESFTAFADDFSVRICKAWEGAFLESRTPETRKIILRTAIVLGHGGALRPYARLARLGLGGRQGAGTQMFSWIHIDDFAGIIEWLMKRESAQGIYNIAAPHAVSNSELMAEIRNALRAPFGLPAPTWMLRIASALIGTEPELLLKSRWVLPGRLFQEGYRFQYGHIDEALRDLLSTTRIHVGRIG
jgi:uncharacterized protein (TIGR01777 family)